MPSIRPKPSSAKAIYQHLSVGSVEQFLCLGIDSVLYAIVNLEKAIWCKLEQNAKVIGRNMRQSINVLRFCTQNDIVVKCVDIDKKPKTITKVLGKSFY